MTTKQAHTPGPWVSGSMGSYGEKPSYHITVPGRNHQTIAIAIQSHGGKFRAHPNIGHDEAVANAALLARAPDLLADVEELRAELKLAQLALRDCLDMTDDQHRCFISRAIDRIETALAGDEREPDAIPCDQDGDGFAARD